MHTDKSWPRHDQGGESTGVWCLDSQLRKAYPEGGSSQPDGQVGRRLTTLDLATCGFSWLQPEKFQ